MLEIAAKSAIGGAVEQIATTVPRSGMTMSIAAATAVTETIAAEIS
jgi:hypothetical protein